MSGMNRMKTFAAAGFALVCAGVIGGLAWATWLTVRLEGYELRAAGEEGLQAALWRIDNEFMPLLAQESGRSYLHYTALYNPTSLYNAVVGGEADRTQYVVQSPIHEQWAQGQGWRDWIDLYFQVTPEQPVVPNMQGDWTSPQAPVTQFLLRGIDTAPADRRKLVEERLGYLRSAVPYHELADRMAAAEDLYSTYERTLEPVQPQQWASATVARGQDRYEAAREKGLQNFQQRLEMNRTVQQSNVPVEACDPVDVLKGTLLPGGAVDSDALPDTSAVRVSALYPMWVTIPEMPGQKLVFLRRVTVGDSPENPAIYQGFLADWGKLSAELLKPVAGLYGDAQLKPAPIVREFKAHSMMATLPAFLDASPVDDHARLLVWNESRATLLLLWVLALVALAVIGLGLRTLLAVSHRRVEFAYAVAHELRTPLTTFRLYTDMLAEGLVPEESKQEYLEILNRESKRLADLVNGVLEYARVENRRVRLNPQTVSADEFLDRARSTFARACEDEGVELVLDNQWKDAAPLRTDIDLVLCVAGVLVANACRHGRNGASSRVVMRLDEAHERIHLDVIDNGPGIETDDARHLYTPFRRGKTAESKAKGGLGLGLALARNWCRLLGGRLELVARKDETLGGAHFRMTLPQLEGTGIS
ncbi:MAG: HAMP domain-containing histidine kinase [Phycisphaerales bacterium]|nr:HAMP domain-containing histidine kinase [Phycisphaerales bacterium]